MLTRNFDWEKVKANTKNIVLINSDNDPWNCTDAQAREPAKKLGAQFVFAKGEGHMGSDSFKQPYREFPILKDLLITD